MIDGETGTTQGDARQELTAGFRGKVSRLIFGGCNVAGRITPEDTEAEEFLQLVADEGDMIVEGYTKKQGYSTNGQYKRVVGGVWIEKPPQ